MKICFKLCLAIALCWLSGTPSAAANQPFAVVELFTSEGCSSCPPADQFLSQITQEAAENKAPVYTLSFHVDYWNYLGWKDPFSKSEYTARQRRYAKALKSDTVYTPQIVVNGRHGYSGNNRSTISKTIDRYLKPSKENSVRVDLKVSSADSKNINVEYSLSGSQSGTILNVALVERNLSNDVTRGENSGRKLGHDNVVREFKAVSPEQAKGTIELTVPAALKQKNASIIAYLQNKQNYHILGASQVDL